MKKRATMRLYRVISFFFCTGFLSSFCRLASSWASASFALSDTLVCSRCPAIFLAISLVFSITDVSLFITFFKTGTGRLSLPYAPPHLHNKHADKRSHTEGCAGNARSLGFKYHNEHIRPRFKRVQEKQRKTLGQSNRIKKFPFAMCLTFLLASF